MLSLIAAAALSASSGAGLLDKADANGDGVVTRQEAIDARVAAFRRADRNGDGVLDDADAPRRPAAASEFRQRTALLKKQFDLDGDGVVTLEEMRTAPTTAFDRADANKDGVLDKSEVEAARKAAASAR